ncbi:MAG TPA: MFS transporter, partial [Holophagaceae bacterium]|nr:MFS transporter [Holophagaceae bacterium]
MRTSTRLLILLTGINLLNYLDRYVVAAVLEPLGRDLHLTDIQLGRLPFVFVVVYMLSAPVFGWLADRYHRPKLVAMGVALWCLATAGAAFVHSYAALLFTRSLVGVGEAAYATLGPALLADVVPEEERAAKFTWFYLAIPVGSAFGYGLGGIVAQHWGWRAAFLVAGLPGLIFAVRMTLLPDPVRGGLDRTKDLAAGLGFGERLAAIFRNRVWLACTGSYVAYTFAMGALSHWAPTLLQRKFGVSTGQAGTVFGGIAVVTG